MVLKLGSILSFRQMSTDRDISSAMIEFPCTRQFYIGARNWLALEPDAPAPHLGQLACRGAILPLYTSHTSG